MRHLKIIWSDFRGLIRVCGWKVALRWLALIVVRFRACVRAGNLQPADQGMGEGPFRCWATGGGSALLAGERIFSGIRELWVRNVYQVTVPSGRAVDLGSNNGNTTLLLLAQGPDVSVVCVEADRALAERTRKSLALNGWEHRAQICNAFIGGKNVFQADLEKGNAGIPYLPEAEFIQRFGLTRIDFLKCDIEGSEFELFRPGSRLLEITHRIGIEIHDCYGDRKTLVRTLEDAGFVVRIVRDDFPLCCTAHAVRAVNSSTLPPHRPSDHPRTTRQTAQ